MRTPRPPAPTLLRASAQELLASFPNGSIDVLLTDPPYTSVERSSGSGHLQDWFRGGISWPEIGRILTLAHRKLKATGLALVLTNAAGLDQAIAALRRAGFAEVRPITWDKCAPGLGGGLRHQTEFVLLGRLPGSRPVSGTDLVSVPAVGPGTRDRYPTEKPEGLGRALAAIAGIGPGDVVVDPFAGSGALLAGAKERGATVIGGDIAARAIKRATERLSGPTKPRPATPPKPPRPSLEGRRPAGRRPIETRHAARRPHRNGAPHG
ncbi:MAG: DNA methyltransferase [Candidatus Limnocylindrales bacterium]